MSCNLLIDIIKYTYHTKLMIIIAFKFEKLTFYQQSNLKNVLLNRNIYLFFHVLAILLRGCNRKTKVMGGKDSELSQCDQPQAALINILQYFLVKVAQNYSVIINITI